jgi:hypothetical protein
MKTQMLLTILVLVGFPAPELFGQMIARGVAVPSSADPRQRRYLRENAVAWAGPAARSLVESACGDEAAVALLRCSRGAARRLAAFHVSGELAKLPSRDLLLAIGHPNGGDAICLYAIKHANELIDPVCWEVFMEAPLEFALGLRQLPAAAAERREQAIPLPAVEWPPMTHPSINPASYRRALTWGGIGLAVAVLLIWRRRRRKNWDFPA